MNGFWIFGEFCADADGFRCDGFAVRRIGADFFAFGVFFRVQMPESRDQKLRDGIFGRCAWLRRRVDGVRMLSYGDFQLN